MSSPPSVVVALAAAVPALAMTMALTTLLLRPGSVGGAAALPDVPSEYLVLYRRAAHQFGLGGDGWSFLAAVGKVECDHGRSTAVGCHRGETNFAGARGPAQFLAGTWAAYGVDGNADGVRDVYDPADAIFGMARYLRASGAPADWRRALYAYNHDWSYVQRVLEWAARYREAPPPPGSIAPTLAGPWLVELPGHPGERCDARVVADVVALTRAYGVRVTDCFGGAPHATDGEHPLGLAVDLVPVDGRWARTLRLARDYGWAPACAAAGCSGRGPFRVILYNGFAGHGDPAHTSSPHLHLSWDHAPAAPFTRAAWVRTLLATASPRPTTCGRTRGDARGAGSRSRRGGAGGSCRD